MLAAFYNCKLVQVEISGSRYVKVPLQFPFPNSLPILDKRKKKHRSCSSSHTIKQRKVVFGRRIGLRCTVLGTTSKYQTPYELAKISDMTPVLAEYEKVSIAYRNKILGRTIHLICIYFSKEIWSTTNWKLYICMFVKVKKKTFRKHRMSVSATIWCNDHYYRTDSRRLLIWFVNFKTHHTTVLLCI